MGMENLLKKLGLTEADFEKAKETDADRITMLEDAFAELCTVVFEEGE